MSWFARVTWSTLGGVFFILLGLCSVWAGMRVAHINRAAAPDPAAPSDPDAPPVRLRRWSAAEALLWRFAWITMGIGISCIGLTELRFAKGQYIVVPANAPLIDHAIWISGLVCSGAGFALLYAGGMTSTVRERRAHQDEAVDECQPPL